MATAATVSTQESAAKAYQDTECEVISFEVAKKKLAEKGKARLIDFEPFPTQEKFLFSTEPSPAFIGGYGCGKTWVATVKAITMSFINAGCTGLFIEPTFAMVDDVAIPIFFDILTENKIPFMYNKSSHNMILPWSRSKILFRSAQYPDRLKGPTTAWALIDEIAQLDEEVFSTAISRVRDPKAKFRQTCVVGTPEGLNWVFERWEETPRPGYPIFYAHTSENTMLPEDYIDNLRGALSPEEIKQKIEGHFTDTVKGLVYGKFFSNENITTQSPFCDPGQILSPALPICLCCDFNIGYGRWVCLQHRDGIIYVFDEISMEDVYTQQMLDEFKDRYGDHPGGVQVFGDPAAHSRHPSATKTDYALIRAAGFGYIDIPKVHPRVRERVLVVNGRFLNANNERRCFVHPNCKNLIKDIKRVKWKAGGSKGILDKESNPSLTHSTDALGYFMHRKYPIHGFGTGADRAGSSAKY